MSGPLSVNVIWRGVLPLVAAEFQARIAPMVGIFLMWNLHMGQKASLNCVMHLIALFYIVIKWIMLNLTVLILKGSSGLYLRVFVRLALS